MRSRRIFPAIVVLGFFSLIGWGWAMWQFIPRWVSSSAEVPEVPAQELPGPITGTLRLIAESPLPPTLLVVTIDEHPFLQLEKTGVDLDAQQSWRYPPEGLRAHLRAEWADYLPGPRAVRVRAYFDGVLISDQIAWGRDEALDRTWHLPGAAELIDAAEALSPPERPEPDPGQSNPALPAPVRISEDNRTQQPDPVPQIFAVPSSPSSGE